MVIVAFLQSNVWSPPFLALLLIHWDRSMMIIKSMISPAPSLLFLTLLLIHWDRSMVMIFIIKRMISPAPSLLFLILLLIHWDRSMVIVKIFTIKSMISPLSRSTAHSLRQINDDNQTYDLPSSIPPLSRSAADRITPLRQIGSNLSQLTHSHSCQSQSQLTHSHSCSLIFHRQAAVDFDLTAIYLQRSIYPSQASLCPCFQFKFVTKGVISVILLPCSSQQQQQI